MVGERNLANQINHFAPKILRFNRLLRKLAEESKLRGHVEHRTGVYSLVHEDASTASTKQVAFSVEFPKKSNKIWLRLVLCILFEIIFCGFLFAKTSEDMSIDQKLIDKIHMKIPSKNNENTISLNFQDIQIKAALQLLAEFSGINMIISENIQGKMSINLNNIPWEQALEIILTTQSLEKRKIGEILYIASSRDLLKNKKLNLQRRDQEKHFELLKPMLYQLKYAKANEIMTLLQEKNASFISSRGSIAADIRTNSIWVHETPYKLKVIKRLIREFDVPIKQVLIEARLVNVTKNFARDIGLRFGVSKPNVFSGTLKGANQMSNNVLPSSVALGERLNYDLAASPLSMAPASFGIALAKLGNGVLLDLELSALESEGLGEVISSPRLITTNQQTALIESGEEIPYQESTVSGATAVAFKKAVLSLQVTPQITPDNQILMDLKINQDILSPKVFNGVPTILTKELQTKVLVKNKQTIVLGGIYKQDKNRAVNRIPFLGKLPYVGSFFKNQSKSFKNEELLIFITPRIISSISSYNAAKKKDLIDEKKIN